MAVSPFPPSSRHRAAASSTRMPRAGCVWKARYRVVYGAGGDRWRVTVIQDITKILHSDTATTPSSTWMWRVRGR